MKVRKRGGVALLLALALILSGLPLVPANEAVAAKKMKLSKTKLALKVGKTKKLTVKNKKKKAKVTWSSSKKKVATVSKKGVVKAKKAGKTTIMAKVKYKKKITKLKCKVTVPKKTKEKETPKPTATDKTTAKPTAEDLEGTAKPTAEPTEDPEGTAKPTAEPIEDPEGTAKPTAEPTEDPEGTAKPTTEPTKDPAGTAKPTAEPTKDPAGTAKPTAEPDKANPWDSQSMGGFYVSGIHFENDALTYRLDENTIHLDLGDKYMTVKEAVPDLGQCIFEVYAGGERYTGVKAADIQWKDSRDGEYVFSLYIEKDGKTWRSDWTMCETRDGSGGYSDHELWITAIQSGGKTIVPQREMPYGANHYIMDPQGANVKEDLPDLKSAEFTATYMGREVTVEKISNVRWIDHSYYEDWEWGTGYYCFELHIRNGAQKESFTLYLSDAKDDLEICRYTYLLDGKEMETVIEDSDVLSVEVPEGRSLKDVWSDPAESFSFDCLYKGRMYEKIRPSDVEWVEKPFYGDQCDRGYYTFVLSVTEDGKEISKKCALVEKYQETSYRISGTLSDADGANPPAGQMLQFTNINKNQNYTALTGEGGSYAVDLPEGSYSVYWNYCPLDRVIKVGKQDMTCEIQTCLKKASGTITRLGKPMADCDIRILLHDYREEAYVIFHTDQNGGYTAYLPERGTASMELCVAGESDKESDKGNSKGMSLIDYDRELLETIHGNNHIIINRVRVCGKIYRTGTTAFADAGFHFVCQDEDSGSWYYGSTGGDGSYEMYLDPDRMYELWADQDNIQITQAFQTGKTDLTKDFCMDAVKIRGTLRTKSGAAVPNHGIELCLQGKDEAVTAWADSRGKYSMVLKPGTYTLKDSLWGVESDQKLTVGESDQVQDLTLPLYQVEMTVYNNNAPWNSSIYVEQNGWMRDDIVCHIEDNKYAMYVPAGTYTCNLVRSDRGAETVTVTDQDSSLELQFKNLKVSGNIYRLAEGMYFDSFSEDQAPRLDIRDVNGNTVEYIYVYRNKYEVYLPGAGDYKVIYNENEVFSFTAEEGPEITQDLICAIYRISGTVSGCQMPSENGDRLCFTDYEGGYQYEVQPDYWDDTAETRTFTAYLPAGNYTYQAFFNDWEKQGEFSVSGDLSDLNIDMPAMYDISGTVTRFSKPFKGAWVECDGTDLNGNGVYRNGEVGVDGSYKIRVPKGNYTLRLSEKSTGTLREETVTVSDCGQVKDFDIDLVKISGTVTRNGKKLLNIPVECWKEGEEYSCSYAQTGDYEEKGRYTLFVAPGASYEVLVAGERKKVTAEREDISLDIAVTSAKISGTVTEADGSAPSDGYGIMIEKKDNEGNVTERYSAQPDWEGKYACYLPAGEYSVSYWTDPDGSGEGSWYEHGTVTVGTADITYDIQKIKPE